MYYKKIEGEGLTYSLPFSLLGLALAARSFLGLTEPLAGAGDLDLSLSSFLAGLSGDLDLLSLFFLVGEGDLDLLRRGLG
jgi:hypothetical protein